MKEFSETNASMFLECSFIGYKSRNFTHTHTNAQHNTQTFQRMTSHGNVVHHSLGINHSFPEEQSLATPNTDQVFDVMCDVIATTQCPNIRKRVLCSLAALVNDTYSDDMTNSNAERIYETVMELCRVQPLIHNVKNQLLQGVHTNATIIYILNIIAKLCDMQPLTENSRLHFNDILSFMVSITNAVIHPSPLLDICEALANTWHSVIHIKNATCQHLFEQKDIRDAFLTFLNMIHDEEYAHSNGSPRQEDDENDDHHTSTCNIGLVLDVMFHIVLESKSSELFEHTLKSCMKEFSFYLMKQNRSRLQYHSTMFIEACYLFDNNLPDCIIWIMLDMYEECDSYVTVDLRDAILHVMQSDPSINVCHTFVYAMSNFYDGNDDLWMVAKCKDLIQKSQDRINFCKKS